MEANRTLQAPSFTLGQIVFQDFEIPQYVRFGGRQRLALHSLADGRRIIERLGPDDGDIQFQGIFSGPAAESRVRVFDELRLSGAAVWLTWESFRREVIVRTFSAVYQSPWWISYQISCTVVHQRRVTSAQSLVTRALVSADLSNALNAATSIDVSLIPLQTALSSQNALTPGATDYSVALTAAGTTLDTLNNQVMNQSALLTVPVAQSSDYITAAAEYTSKVSSAGTLAAAIAVRSYVGRIQVNLAGLTT